MITKERNDHRYIDALVHERRNSIAIALELRISCTDPSMCFNELSQNAMAYYLHSAACQILLKLPSVQWRHNGRDGISNHQPHDCLHNRLFRRRSRKTSKLRVLGLCAGNSPVTGEFPAQMASDAKNVSISWRHQDPVTQWCKQVSVTYFVHPRMPDPQSCCSDLMIAHRNNSPSDDHEGDTSILCRAASITN